MITRLASWGIKTSLGLSLALCFGPSSGQSQATTIGQASPINEYSAVHHPVVGRKGMVASQNEVATRVGVEVLKQGGNAIDASVAVGLALAVTLPRAGNIGGGGFMLVHLAEEQRTVAIDFRETAPALADPDMFFGADGEVDNGEYRSTHKSSAIPGTIAGLAHILQKYGTMDWADLVEPALILAREGFPVTEDLANNLRVSKAKLTANPLTASIFYKAGAQEYQVGEMFRQPQLAWTLDQLKTYGPETFYQGEIAKRLVSGMERHNGLITMEDLKNYTVIEREPVRGTFRDFDITAMSAPSSGGMAIVQMLNILEYFPIR
jgi:gamma-glutamyltranspeptidase/glutathione hydrolase